jgi:multidrug resistance efflux pump
VAQPTAADEVTLMGNPTPRGTVSIAAPVNGVLEVTEIALGGEVLMGQIIGRVINEGLSADSDSIEEQMAAAHDRITNLEAQLNSSRLEATRATAEAAASESDMERTKSTAERQELLFKEGVTSRNSYEQAKKDAAAAAAEHTLLRESARAATERSATMAADLAAAQKSIEAFNAALEAASENLRHGEVLSPIDGVLVGARYLPGDKVPSGTTDLYLVAPNALQLTVPAEANPEISARFRDGLAAEVTLASVPEQTFQGHMVRNATGAWEVQFETREPVWKPGDQATIKIHLPAAQYGSVAGPKN